MANIGTSLVSSSSRPMRLCMRADLIADEQCYQGRRYFVIKDPVALKYYRFEEEEYALLEMLDGKTSPDDIKRQFERRFSPQKLTLIELQQFSGMLHRSSLVVSDSAGQGEQLRKRRAENLRRERLGSLTNILAIRFKGFNPDRLLSWLDSQIGWFFSWPAFVACVLLALSALLLVTAEFDVFKAKLPAFQEFFAMKNWFWLAITLAITKVCHEFGHGLACKRMGGECHEMGVMFLVLTPCLYCNVSDSWMLPSKWKRAAIGGAGMYVELVIASLATFLWWFSQPGMLNYLCLNIMFVCSASTILFNANPLLRYDGYYILSDLTEIPNLRQKASTILRRTLGSWMLGLPEPFDPFLPQRRQWLFALYAVAAAAYRWVLAFSIFWLLYRMFEPHGLKILGQLIAFMSLYALLVMPLWQLGKFFYIPGRIERVNKVRMFASVFVLGVLLGGIALMPLPHYVSGSLHIQPRGASAVYVDVPGTVQMIHANSDQLVEPEQVLVTLENVDEWLEIAQLEGQMAEEKALLNSLIEADLEGDDAAALEIGRVKQSIATIDETLKNRIEDVQRLIIKSPTSGTIMPAPYHPAETDEEENLATWSGTPLDVRNTGAFYNSGTLVCHVGDPTQLEAILVIDQSDIEFVGNGQNVEIFVEHLPGRQFESRVDQISRMEMKNSPRNLSSKTGGNLDTRTDAAGRERPLSTSFEVSAPLNDAEHVLRIGGSGQGRIHVGHQTIGKRVWRYICRTFSFEM